MDKLITTINQFVDYDLTGGFTTKAKQIVTDVDALAASEKVNLDNPKEADDFLKLARTYHDSIVALELLSPQNQRAVRDTLQAAGPYSDLGTFTEFLKLAVTFCRKVKPPC